MRFFFICLLFFIASAKAIFNVSVSNINNQYLFFIPQGLSSNATFTFEGTNLYNISRIIVGSASKNNMCYSGNANYSLAVAPCLQKYTRNQLCALMMPQYPTITSTPCAINQSPCANETTSTLCTTLTSINDMCSNAICYSTISQYCLAYSYLMINQFSTLNGYEGVECDANTVCSSSFTCVPKAPVDKCPNSIQCTMSHLEVGENPVTIYFNDGTNYTSNSSQNTIVVFAYPTITATQNLSISPQTVFSISYQPTLASLNATFVTYLCTDLTGQNAPFQLYTNIFPTLNYISTTTVPLGTHIVYPYIVCSIVLSYQPYGFVSALPSYSNNNLTFQFLPLPQLYGVCPNQMLEDLPATVIIQGDDFVDSSNLLCILDNDIVVKAVFITAKSISCTLLYVNKTSPAIVNLTVTNDGVSVARIPLTIDVVGACNKIKPNSIASGSSCICPAGFEDVNNAFCQQCADGFYQPNTNQQSCIPCDATETTGGVTGSLSPAACVCKQGLYKANVTQNGCVQCPYGLDCSLAAEGNYTVLAGFWRAKPDSTVIIPCASGKTQCPAGNSGYGNQLCAVGYKGPACSICKKGYGNIGGLCLKCPDKGLNGFLLFLLIVATLTIVYILVKSTTRQEKKGDTLGVTVKVLIAYMQVLYYIGKTSAHWSDQSTRFFQALIPVTLSPSFLSIQCATDFGFYKNIALMMILPIIIVIGVSVAHVLLYIYKNNKRAHSYFFEDCLDDNSKVTLVLLSLVHPTISQDVIRSFRCTSVAGTGTSFMTDDMRVDCSSHSYHSYVIVASLYVVFYIAGFLALVMYRIIVKKDMVDMANNGMYMVDARIYVFFVRGYKRDYYLWEFMIIFRKIAIVIINSLFPEPVQLVWANLVIGVSLALTAFFQPYRSILVNRLDVIALTTLLFTIMLGFHSRLLPTPNQHAVFVLLVFVNTLATLLLVLSAFNNLKPKIAVVVEKIIYFCDINKFKRKEFGSSSSGIKMQSRDDIVAQRQQQQTMQPVELADGWETEQ